VKAASSQLTQSVRARLDITESTDVPATAVAAGANGRGFHGDVTELEWRCCCPVIVINPSPLATHCHQQQQQQQLKLYSGKY